MSATPILLTPAGGAPISVISARMFHFWRGAWIVDCELDPTQPTPTAIPSTSGKAQLSLASSSLVGTIDPRGSGSFLTKATVRLVGGGNGWDQVVARQSFHSDTGVNSTTVYSNTAALIGETVKDLAPQVFPILDFERANGPASRVFANVDYWLGLDGVTNVGPRPPSDSPDSMVITDYEPIEAKVDFGADGVLFPNTTLIDPRFNGATPIVRDVEQVFDASGSHGWAWVGTSPATRLTAALQSVAKESTGQQFQRGYQYRVAIYEGNRVVLQSVNAGMPDISPLTPWTGVSGIIATLKLGSIVFVTFDHTTEPPQPIGISFDPNSLPQSISLMGGGHSVAFADKILAELVKISAAITSLGGSYPVPVTPIGSLTVTSG